MKKSTGKDLYRASMSLTLFALLFAAIQVFNFGSPIFKSIFENVLVFHCIGFSIMFLLQASGVYTMKRSLYKGIVLLILFVFGGWTGLAICYGILIFIFRYPLSIEWIKESLVPVSFFSIFFSLVLSSYETIREKLNDTAAKLAEKEISEKNLLRLKTKAELEALRAKVNPHFLFNTLNSIASLIPQDPNKAEKMVLRLSSLFRYTLDASSHDRVKLSEEINIIREYLEIEKVRLGERLKFSIVQDEQLADMMIPGLLLQPLVENSVKHGISSRQAGGEINLRCYRENSKCCIEIMDTGDGFSFPLSDSGFGLHVVRDRLDLLYGPNYEFHITGDQGVRIFISLPLVIPEKTEG